MISYRKVAFVFAVMVAVVGFVCGGAKAEGSHEFDIQTITPTPDINGFLFTEGADNFEKDFEFTTGLLLDYTLNPLVIEELYGNNEFKQRDIVGYAWRSYLFGSVRLHSLVRVGMTLPITLYQDGSALALGKSLAHAGLGDMRLSVKFTPFPFFAKRSQMAGFSFALYNDVIFPTGSKDGLVSDGAFGNELGLVADYKWKFLHVGFNFSWWARQREVVLHEQYVDDLLRYKLAAGIDFAKIDALSGIKAWKALQVYTELLGATYADDPFYYKYENPIEQTIGARYNLYPFIGHDVVFTTGAGWGYNSGIGTPTFRWFAGVSYSYIVHDSDNDGLTDDVDKCINAPEDKDGFEDNDGCPDPDNDKDGIADASDKCPNDAEDKDGFEDDDGCPDPDNDKDGIADNKDLCPDSAEDKDGFEDNDGCPESDNDKDGIADTDDKCPNKPEDVDGFEDKDGCPDLDNDKDGIPDNKDLCPNSAEDKDGFEDEDGCPDADNDKDGVCDPWVVIQKQESKYGCVGEDKCPAEPETINGVKDEDGCPDKGKVLVVLKNDKIEIKQRVFFETGSAVIKRKSFKLLRQVAQLLRGHSEIEEVTIEGHTDNRGNPKRNMELSQARAEAVRDFLINMGISPSRLKAVGYGSTKPIASNRTRRGRAKNRRVEFRITKVKGQLGGPGTVKPIK